MDQCTVRTDMHNRKAWYNRDVRFKVPLAKGKDTSVSVTIFGAVGKCILTNKCFYYEFHESTNARAFE